MALLQLTNLTKCFDKTNVVDGVSFTVDEGELVCLLGPSGCGKTTLLRLIAGLEQPDEGTVFFDGQPVNKKPSEQRGFGLMFQDLALFPHMDVSENVGFGLRMKRLPKKQIQKRVSALLDLIDMAGYSHRKIHQLSGGERQRVALARALAPTPRLLMLDEPLGALDRVLRDSLQSEVRKILREIGVTSIYVTHDRDEAFTMADKLIFMNKGQVIRSGHPKEIFQNPESAFVARTLGFKNILQGVTKRNGNFTEISSQLGSIHINTKKSDGPSHNDDTTILIDEDGIDIYPQQPDPGPHKNMLFGTVKEIIFKGTGYDVTVQIGQAVIYSSISLEHSMENIQENMNVTVSIRPTAIKILKNP